MSRVAGVILPIGLVLGAAMPAIAATAPNGAPRSSVEAQRMTKALNILEANGYGGRKARAIGGGRPAVSALASRRTR